MKLSKIRRKYLDMIRVQSEGLYAALLDIGENDGGDLVVDMEDSRYIALAPQIRSAMGSGPLTLNVIMKAARGNVNALVGVDRPPDDVIKTRTDICKTCPNATLVNGVFQACTICKCLTWPKIRNASEHCPLGFW